MLSRIADSLFWLNRYMERSEGMLRMIRTTYIFSLDKRPYSNNNWKILLEVFAGMPPDEASAMTEDINGTIQYLLIGPANNNSTKLNLSRARENARGMQDHITKEVWEQVNHMYHLINSDRTISMLESNNPIPSIELLQKNCLLYTGIADSTMPRTLSWCFMNLGKYIERCLLTIDLLEKHYHVISFNFSDAKDILYWRELLFALSGYEFHLKNYRSSDTNYNVAHQVIFNAEFPHSIFYCLSRIKNYLDAIIKENNPPAKKELIKEFGRIYSSVEFADFEWINRTGFSIYLNNKKENLYQFANLISQVFFSY